jgi:hypothetical protein
VSSGDFVSYWAARNVDQSNLDAEVIEAAVINAMDYVENRFRFKGMRTVPETQALSWPRCRVYTREGIAVDPASVPLKVRSAVCEYASRALTAALAPDPTLDSNITARMEIIGPITEQVSYAGGANRIVLKEYPAADMLLADYVTGEDPGCYR